MEIAKKLWVHFLGAAGTVTGSKYLVESEGKKLLIDCGLFQGLKKLREQNWAYPPVNANEIDVILLTHAHLDHCGYILRLIKQGFKGQILGTSATLDIAKIILRDSANIQEEEAARANQEGYTKHDPAEPLYTLEEAETAITHFAQIQEGEWIDWAENIRFRYQYNGHILGSCFIELKIADKLLLFSGDIGRKNDLLLPDPKKPTEAHFLFIETTYGDRLHPKEDVFDLVEEIVNQTLQKAGNVIIPSFAVERAQTLMYILWKLKKHNRIPHVPFIMDSPMGANVLKVFDTHKQLHKLSIQECKEMCDQFNIVDSYKETIRISQSASPKIIIAGSGMITGGRVLHYLQAYLDKPETTVMLVGFQAEGTRGRKLQEGSSELSIYGKYYPVKAKIEMLRSLSTHGDQSELIDWLSELKTAPRNTFLVHGEPHAANAFRSKLEHDKKWKITIPELYQIFEL